MGKRKSSKKLHFGLLGKLALIVIVVAVVSVWFLFFRNMTDKSHIIFVHDGDTADEVIQMVGENSRAPQFAVFKTLANILDLNNHLHEGRYDIGHRGALDAVRTLRNGNQTPTHVIVPSARKLEDIAKSVCKKVRFKKEEFMAVVTDTAFIDSLGYKPETIIGAFTPNTYDVYWNISPRNFVKRMVSESDKFWNEERLKKAEEDSLTRMEVITLASIVQEETNIAKDKPVIAGLYIHRLRIGMLLQSCPTIRYALNDFTITFITNSMLTAESPYNTYKYKGLPPGPIRNPNPEDIDAVLNYDHNDYLYMCASAKFDGTHHFTKTYAEHKAYSVEYDKAYREKFGKKKAAKKQNDK